MVGVGLMLTKYYRLWDCGDNITVALLMSATLITAWISNYIHYKVWDEITYSFLNFNGATVKV